MHFSICYSLQCRGLRILRMLLNFLLYLGLSTNGSPSVNGMVEFLVYMFINFTEIKHLLSNKNVLKEDII